jgi:beta-aspartyl-peptidase (threonine type)
MGENAISGPALIVHGGAGRIKDGRLQEREEGCRQAVLEGWRILQAGGSALDAVEKAVVVLEDNPLFNAGKGSVLNRDGEIEMDAGIMEGAGLRAGAVAAVKNVKNPIRLARQVMEKSEHVLLVGEGAFRFAREIESSLTYPLICQREDLITENRLKERISQITHEERDTVGAVAIDRRGCLAAATSTGGISGKYPGRVGDSPLIGCGIYADNQSGGVSCTGHGEFIIRIVWAKSTADFLLTRNCPAQEAANRAIDLLYTRIQGFGGLILIDRWGQIGFAYNTPHMSYAFIKEGMENIVSGI